MRVGCEERIGLQAARPFESLFRRVGCDVEQQRGDAGIGEVRGNLSAHHTCAQHGDRVDHAISLDVIGVAGPAQPRTYNFLH